MIQIEENVKKIDKVFFEIKSKINYLDYFNPVNFEEEKVKFFDMFFDGKKYNPIFRYKSTNLKKYQKLKIDLNKVDVNEIKNKNFKKIFAFYKRDLANRIELFYNIGNDKKIFEILKNVFGNLDKKLFNECTENIKKTNSLFPILDNDTKLTKTEVINRTKQTFEENNINWQIKFRKEGALASVDTNKHILFYKESSKGYSENFFNILIAHEVLGHIRQSNNAQKFGLKIFETGFGYYDLLQEGWALYNEKKANREIENRLYIYYITTFIASKKSFYETFCFLLQYLDIDNAYSMTARLKRGLCNTSIHGAFLKDKAYLEGFKMLNSATKKELKLVESAVFDFRYKKEVFNILKEIKK